MRQVRFPPAGRRQALARWWTLEQLWHLPAPFPPERHDQDRPDTGDSWIPIQKIRPHTRHSDAHSQYRTNASNPTAVALGSRIPAGNLPHEGLTTAGALTERKHREPCHFLHTWLTAFGCSPIRRIQGRSQPLPFIGKQVTVTVHGDGDRGVAQVLLDGPGMSPFVDENGRAGVPQIVEPETDRESSGLHCRLELPTIEVVVEQPQAAGACEHELRSVNRARG